MKLPTASHSCGSTTTVLLTLCDSQGRVHCSPRVPGSTQFCCVVRTTRRNSTAEKSCFVLAPTGASTQKVITDRSWAADHTERSTARGLTLLKICNGVSEL